MTRYCVVITKSTVPVGTADKVCAELQKTLQGRGSRGVRIPARAEG